MKVLAAGWFSFEGMGATAGDLLARDLVCEWLEDAGRDYDVAVASPFTGGVDWQTVDPAAYSEIVFVCGPFGNGWPVTEFLARFSHCRLIGIDLSLLQPLEEWNPFDVLVERDSSRAARPDLTFLSKLPKVPVVGLVLVHHQKEYPEGAHEAVEVAIDTALSTRDVAVVPIDTRLDINATGLRTPAQVESLIARMDVVVTTRLHGLVLALKNDVPAVVIDPIPGGAKVLRQARAVGWPHVLVADTLAEGDLDRALDVCLSEAGRELATRSATSAREALATYRQDFLSGLA